MMEFWKRIFSSTSPPHRRRSPTPSPPPSPLPSPTLGRPWRTINWSEDRQKHLTTLNNFQPGNTNVKTLRILLYGPQGAGKSSFFNSVNNVFQGRITTRAGAGSISGFSFTSKCKTFKVKDNTGAFLPFTLTDIAGMHHGNSLGTQTDDIIKLFKGHINDGYTFNPASPITEEEPRYKRNPELKDRIHCLVAVVPANIVSIMDENIIRQIEKVRQEAQHLDIPQVLILTKVDEVCPLVKDNLEKIYTSKQIKQKIEQSSVKLGFPVNCIFPVKNYHEEHTTNGNTDILILDALKTIINFANDYVEDQEDSAKATGLQILQNLPIKDHVIIICILLALLVIYILIT